MKLYRVQIGKQQEVFMQQPPNNRELKLGDEILLQDGVYVTQYGAFVVTGQRINYITEKVWDLKCEPLDLSRIMNISVIPHQKPIQMTLEETIDEHNSR